MPADILRAQVALKAHYYDPGPIDGLIGKKTLNAASNFAFEHDLRKNTDAPLAAITPELVDAIEAAPIWARGIDVSHWQNDRQDPIGDLALAKASGISWVIIKCGGGDGGLYQDSEYSPYSHQARACGLIQGAYFFHHFSRDPVKQAEKCYAITGPLQPGDLPPALDVEDYKTLIKGQAAIDHIMATLTKMESLYGKKPLLYTSASVLRTHSADFDVSHLSAYDLWIPAYGVKSPAKRIPACHKGVWKFWQPGYNDELPGFGNDTDRGFFKGTEAELRAYVGL